MSKLTHRWPADDPHYAGRVKSVTVAEVEDGVILCPVCRFHCVHFGRSTTGQEATDELGDLRQSPEVIVTPEDNDKGSPLTPYYGGHICVPMFCESGHNFDLFLAHHKGSIHVAFGDPDDAEPPPPTNEELLDYATNPVEVEA